MVSIGRDSGSTALYRKNVRPMVKSGIKPRVKSPDPPRRLPKDGRAGGIGGMPHHLVATCNRLDVNFLKCEAHGKEWYQANSEELGGI